LGEGGVPANDEEEVSAATPEKRMLAATREMKERRMVEDYE